MRSLVGIALLLGTVWCSFRVPLGERTLAQHMDRIGQTPEAEELLDGTRSAVNPVLEQASDRVLGEYIEAPTDEGPIPPPGFIPLQEEAPRAHKRRAGPPALPHEQPELPRSQR